MLSTLEQDLMHKRELLETENRRAASRRQYDWNSADTSPCQAVQFNHPTMSRRVWIEKVQLNP
jgi:hypothetical protein